MRARWESGCAAERRRPSCERRLRTHICHVAASSTCCERCRWSRWKDRTMTGTSCTSAASQRCESAPHASAAQVERARANAQPCTVTVGVERWGTGPWRAHFQYMRADGTPEVCMHALSSRWPCLGAVWQRGVWHTHPSARIAGFEDCAIEGAGVGRVFSNPLRMHEAHAREQLNTPRVDLRRRHQLHGPLHAAPEFGRVATNLSHQAGGVWSVTGTP